MRPRSPQLLEDIRDAAAFIAEVTGGVTLERYAADRMLRQAVERNFEIIGEAVKRLSAADAATAARIGHREQIIAFRNILIHGYATVDDKIVWGVIENHLRSLRDSVRALLATT